MSCERVNININSLEAMNVIDYHQADANPNPNEWKEKYKFRVQMNPIPYKYEDEEYDLYLEGIYDDDDRPSVNPAPIDDITDDELSYAANTLDETPEEVYALYTGPRHTFMEYVNNPPLPYREIAFVGDYSIDIYDDFDDIDFNDDIEPNRDPDDE